MKKQILAVMVVFGAALLMWASPSMASQSQASNSIGYSKSSTDSQMAYRYHYPKRGCYYIKNCVRVNRWGKCVKYRWILKCGPRRYL